MPPVIKKPCVNNNNFSYSGKECSPLGKGYTADAEQVGTIMEGRDSTMWMVGIKNGVKVWNRVPTDLAHETESIVNPDVPKNQENQPSPKKEPVATKKKQVTKKVEKVDKKKSIVEVSESEDDKDIKSSSDSENEDIVKKEEDKIPLSPIKETSKKTTNVKKKAQTKKEVPAKKEVPEVSNDKPVEKVEKEKKARKPTDFNIFMSYQIKIVSQENPNMSHKDKFAKVASLWKELSDSEKKEVLIKAKAAAEKK